ncbi:LOW QUALITY PROTEIN: olfactory receptor 13H1 [Megaptera novaeangliae]
MAMDNATAVFEFLLTGISNYPEWRVTFFTLVLITYLRTLLGNGLIIFLTHIDPHLHTPMYFFLSNLSFLDLCYGTVSMPQALVHCFSTHPYLSYPQCLTQISVSLVLATAECLLLAVMAYDHVVAISNPLCYSVVTNGSVCVWLAATSWGASFVLTAMLILSLQVHFCGANVINHFVCEILSFLKLACSDTSLNELMIFITSIFLILPFGFVLLSYVRIATAVLRIRSAQGGLKAFSTCGSHLSVVAIFYGAAISMYMKPQSKSSPDKDKFISVFYGDLTPMLNPLIYSLRNKDVKGAMRKVMAKRETVTNDVTEVDISQKNAQKPFKSLFTKFTYFYNTDTLVRLILGLVFGILTLPLPFTFIFIAYTRIVVVVLRIRSAEARLKTFSTCGSHLTVVTIFYGTATCMYLKPQSREYQDQGKVTSAFYSVVSPVLNPLIYTLRNKNVKDALRKIIKKK